MDYLHTVQLISGGAEGSLVFTFKIVTKTATKYTSIEDITNDVNNFIGYECVSPLVGEDLLGFDDWNGGPVNSAIYKGAPSITSEKICCGNILVTEKNGTETTVNPVADVFYSDKVTESTPRKSVDLTTLAGWEALSAGTHNITIVAKANGYRDSEPSAAVSVEKAAEDALAGTWVFNDDCPNLLERSVSFTFNFMVKEEPVSTLVIDTSSAVTPADIVFLYYDDTVAADSTGELAGIPTWIDDACKTITITSKLSEVTDGKDLLAWLQANATKQ